MNAPLPGHVLPRPLPDAMRSALQQRFADRFHSALSRQLEG